MIDIFSENNKELLTADLFNVGETVRIHPNIRPTQKGVVVAEQMAEYASEYATITGIEDNAYRVDIDDGDFIWQDFMFEIPPAETINEEQVWNML